MDEAAHGNAETAPAPQRRTLKEVMQKLRILGATAKDASIRVGSAAIIGTTLGQGINKLSDNLNESVPVVTWVVGEGENDLNHDFVDPEIAGKPSTSFDEKEAIKLGGAIKTEADDSTGIQTIQFKEDGSIDLINQHPSAVPEDIAWLITDESPYDKKYYSQDIAISKSVNFDTLKQAKFAFVHGGHIIVANPDDTYSMYSIFYDAALENVKAEDLNRYKDFLLKHSEYNSAAEPVVYLQMLMNRNIGTDELRHLDAFIESMNEQHLGHQEISQYLLFYYTFGTTPESRQNYLTLYQDILNFFSSPHEMEYSNSSPEQLKKNTKEVAFAISYLTQEHDDIDAMRAHWEEVVPYLMTIQNLGGPLVTLDARETLSYIKQLQDKNISAESIPDMLRKWDVIQQGIDKEEADGVDIKNLTYKSFLDVLATDDPQTTLDAMTTVWEMAADWRIEDRDWCSQIFTRYGITTKEKKDELFAAKNEFDAAHPNLDIDYFVQIEYIARALAQGIDVSSPEVQRNLEFFGRVADDSDAFRWKFLDKIFPDMDISLEASYGSEKELILAIMRQYNKDFDKVNSKEMAHFINGVHDESGKRHIDDLRPEMIAQLDSNAMMQLIADGGAHVPHHYYLQRDRPKAHREAMEIGQGDYGIAMYTSTFEGINQQLETLRQENPDEYRELLKADEDRLVRFTFMLSRFGKLERDIALNPDLFIKPLQHVLASENVGLVDWQILLSGVTAGLESERSEDYQRMIYDLYWTYENSGDTEGRAAIGFLIKTSDQLQKGPYGKMLSERFKGYADPETISLPDWSKKQEIKVGLFYNAKDISEEGMPSAMSELAKDGFTLTKEDRNNLNWEMEKRLPDGRVVKVRITADAIAKFDRDEQRPDFVASLFHSYWTGDFYTDALDEKDWKDTVFYNGFCGSARLVTFMNERGYSGPMIGDLDIANGYINMMAIRTLLTDLMAGGSKSWPEVEERLGGLSDRWGLRTPGQEQALVHYVVENRDQAIDAHFDQQWQIYWQNYYERQASMTPSAERTPSPN